MLAVIADLRCVIDGLSKKKEKDAFLSDSTRWVPPTKDSDTRDSARRNKNGASQS
jgi:hypothetical protein